MLEKHSIHLEAKGNIFFFEEYLYADARERENRRAGEDECQMYALIFFHSS